jgi:hypothetical protein
MQDMEKPKIDGEWKKAFDQAEVNPSDNVWVNIELDLEKAKGSQLKKRLLFYQLLAAASVLFSIGAGVGVYVLQDTISSQTHLATQNATSQETVKKETGSPLIASESTRPATEKENEKESGVAALENIEKVTRVSGGSVDNGKEKVNNNQSNSNVSLVALFNNDETENSVLDEDKMKLPSLVTNRKIKFERKMEAETEAVDPVLQMMARLEQREKEVSESDKDKDEDKKYGDENLWTSVGFAAGTFNSVNAGVSSPQPNSMMALNKPGADDEAKASGISYSMGVNLGTKLSERWVFQGGVSYLTQSSDYTATTAVADLSRGSQKFRPQSINELENFEDASEESIVQTSPYNVNNNLRYLSIPLQAGYLVVNRAFGLQINAGVATDVFLQNVVTAEGQNLDKTTQRIGEDSPYRTVNLSGLMGTEVSYRFGEHYRVALIPGIRYPFNSIYRSAVDVKSSPLTFDVGLRFRYIFH